jgi:hypothetical protein
MSETERRRDREREREREREEERGGFCGMNSVDTSSDRVCGSGDKSKQLPVDLSEEVKGKD